MIQRVVVLLLFVASISSAQPFGFVHREVRAVWVTTAAGLDWPPSTNQADQVGSLRRIVSDLHNAHFNTIYFQARARGDAYYRSRFEPWAENLTGTPGKDPGWDPLAELLRDAHAVGMEVHAWFNVFKVRGGTVPPVTTPPHPSRALSQWTVDYAGEGWLDPGVPAVREYLIGVALDLVSRYDVDGINFDFIRYPARGFPDDATYRQYGNGVDKGAWRRQNVTRFLAGFVERVRTLRPKLKIGCSPLGIAEEPRSGNNGNGLTAFAQDAREWLRSGLVDYASAQIYWDIGASFRDPDFASVAREWRASSRSRQIIAGIGAYKQEVLAEIPRQIDSARAAGTDGQAFFRLENIRSLTMFGGRYSLPALIPPMAWRDSIPPEPPAHISSSELAPNVFLIEWSTPRIARDGDTTRYFSIYRNGVTSAEPQTGRQLVALLSGPVTSYVDSITTPSALTYRYEVRSVDRTWNESSPLPTNTAPMKEVLALGRKTQQRTSLSTSLIGQGGSPSLAAYSLARRDSIRLDLVLRRPGLSDTTITTLVRAEQDPGMYVVGLQRVGFRPGVYVLRLAAGEAVIEQLLLIQRQ